MSAVLLEALCRADVPSNAGRKTEEEMSLKPRSKSQYLRRGLVVVFPLLHDERARRLPFFIRPLASHYVRGARKESGGVLRRVLSPPLVTIVRSCVPLRSTNHFLVEGLRRPITGRRISIHLHTRPSAPPPAREPVPVHLHDGHVCPGTIPPSGESDLEASLATHAGKLPLMESY